MLRLVNRNIRDLLLNTSPSAGVDVGDPARLTKYCPCAGTCSTATHLFPHPQATLGTLLTPVPTHVACYPSSMGLFSCFGKAGSFEPQPSSISSKASHPQGTNASYGDHSKQGNHTQEPDSVRQVALPLKGSQPANALPSPNPQAASQHREKPAQACCGQPGPPWKSARASGDTWRKTRMYSQTKADPYRL